MSYKPAKWPTYALESLEDTLSLLKNIEKELNAAQVATRKGDTLDAIILQANARTMVAIAFSTLALGKVGEYKRQ